MLWVHTPLDVGFGAEACGWCPCRQSLHGPTYSCRWGSFLDEPKNLSRTIRKSRLVWHPRFGPNRAPGSVLDRHLSECIRHTKQQHLTRQYVVFHLAVLVLENKVEVRFTSSVHKVCFLKVQAREGSVRTFRYRTESGTFRSGLRTYT